MAENVEKETTVISAAEKECNYTVDQEKDELTPDEAEIEDSKPDAKHSDLSGEEASKANDDNHNEPETGEFEESSLSSIKELGGDGTEDKVVPPVDNISVSDSNLEVRPVKIHFPIHRPSSYLCHSLLVLGHLV